MDGVTVIINRQDDEIDRYLMIQQVPGKPQPFKWYPPSGVIREGETEIEACYREVMEELGPEFMIIVGEKLVTLKSDYKTENSHFYPAKYLGGEVEPNPKEIHHWGWFTYEEILGLNLMKLTRKFFEKHFKGFELFPGSVA